jgi:para-aminobenzoate synthetase component I
LFSLKKNELSLHYFESNFSTREAVEILNDVLNSEPEVSNGGEFNSSFKCSMDKEEYIEKVMKIKWHIQRGDIYEMNFCMDFFAENISVNPVQLASRLFEQSPAPFSAYYRFDDRHLFCASPERYLRRKGDHIISHLLNDEKEKSENVMITDLVRNDLSRIATRGSVNVEELFGIYSFRHVHQMISTVSCRQNENTGIADILKATFPMGSMTGAPKVKAMELIEKYEKFRRGLFSGTVGYISPSGDFDFNVVIRSIFFNETIRYISISAGSAITGYCNPENEYEECCLKAKALIDAVSYLRNKN